MRPTALHVPDPNRNYYAALTRYADNALTLPSSIKQAIRGEGVLNPGVCPSGRLTRRTSNTAMMASHKPPRGT
jgi:hypothetical protein